MRRDALVLLAVFAFAPPKACVLRKKSGAADASADAASAAATATASAAATATASAAATATASAAPPPDPSVDRAKEAFSAIESDVARGVLKDKTHPDDPDAVARCAELDDLRPKLEARPEPDAKRILDDSQKLCASDVPILSATETLRQVTISPSQASRRLMCKYAQKDIAKARAWSASDRRVRELDQRWQRVCL